MERVLEIALAYPRFPHRESFFEGVLKYANEHGRSWSYITGLESLSMSVLDLVGWPGDGVLAAICTEEEAACAASLPIPVVNISCALDKTPVPRCAADFVAMGKIAAAHLLDKGFQSFAYYGLTDVGYSNQRRQGFEERLKESGFEPAVYLSKPTFRLGGSEWLQQNRQLAEWMLGLKRPVGLFAVSDYRARQVLDACRLVGLKVPEEVAIVGVDNERIICDHVHPTLTSIARNNLLEGYRAAELLDRMIQGEDVPLEAEPVSPLEIVERDSTATFAVSDPRLRDALNYLHLHIEDPLSIDEVTRHAGVSRRWLEYAFRDALGETPYQYLRRQRLAHARRLLASEPGAKIYNVAQRSGFTSAKQLTIAFHQDFGMSPREYRRAAQS
jgi:LacI family transcriptional regulator